jgi:hypothetical protein
MDPVAPPSDEFRVIAEIIAFDPINDEEIKLVKAQNQMTLSDYLQILRKFLMMGYGTTDGFQRALHCCYQAFR